MQYHAVQQPAPGEALSRRSTTNSRVEADRASMAQAAHCSKQAAVEWNRALPQLLYYTILCGPHDTLHSIQLPVICRQGRTCRITPFPLSPLTAAAAAADLQPLYNKA